MKLLLVGDLHVKKDNLQSSATLIKWIKTLADKNNTTVLFLGDQFNEFGLARVEVIAFWHSAYGLIKDSISLVGNHDLNPDGTATSMLACSKQTTLIGSEPTIIDDKNKIGAVGFIRDWATFQSRVMQLYEKGIRTVICHAEFNGAQYENGFYSPHGFDPDAFPDDLMFISGHIHKKQYLRSPKTNQVRVAYIGSPRMLTRSDVGQIKTVTLWNTEVDTYQDIEVPAEVCPRFEEITITPENVEILDTIVNSPLIYVDLKGPKDFIQKFAKKVPDNVKLRTLPDPEERRKTTARESDGIEVAFSKFVKSYASENNLSTAELSQILAIIVTKVPSLKVGL